MPILNCTRCGRKLSKPRLAARKQKCYPCECAVRREQRQRTHDRNIESEDFTSADYWQLFEAQDGTCAVYSCRAKGKSKHLTVEHDHACENGHDPKRWCRACVRGLTCGQHNEWIGRSGDDPEVFDSLASYLRDPPAREMLMDKMQVAPLEEAIAILHDDYRVPWTRARKMLDLARGVGPSPTKVPGDRTIVIKYVRIPRSNKAVYSITESARWVDSKIALKQLMDEYGLSERRAKTALNTAWEKGQRGMPTPKGVRNILIKYHGRGANQSYMFSIEEQA
jgi:recombination endonuclease VII